MAGPGLPTQQLVEFLAFVSAATDEETAARNATEGAAHLIEAELAAVVVADKVVSTLGFPRGQVPHDEILRAAGTLRGRVMVPGIGVCMTVVGRSSRHSPVGLVVARLPEESFSTEETNLVRGMGRVLDLTMGMIGVLQAERELRERSERQAEENAELLRSLQARQHLLEELSRIQRAISRHEPLASIFETIVTAARDLTGANAAALRLADDGDPSRGALVSSTGLGELARGGRRLPFASDAASQAMTSDQAVRMGSLEDSPPAGPPTNGSTKLIAAPVHEGLAAAGALWCEAQDGQAGFGAEDEATLVALADHASLALSDARTVEQMHSALRDSLTGLASRPLFLEALRRNLLSIQAEGGQVAVLFIDLDRFKLINDTLGHSSGDLLLIEVGRRIERGLRASDVSARFGGDEFAVLLWGEGCRQRATAVAGRLISELSMPYSIGGRQIYASASIGITLSDGTDEAENIIRDADVAMYQAKQNGRGCYAVFEPDMREQFFQRVQMESELRRAMDNGDLTLHFQPVIALTSGEIIGAEALLRWPDPRRGMIPPLEFIPIAEETGLMPAIGRWILREACHEAAMWDFQGAPFFVGVNVSAGQLRDGNLVDEVAAALVESKFDPGHLVLELTESLLLPDDAITMSQLDQLKDLGIKLAIDDFGRGYSSLSYLRRFPLDVLKIDRSLICDVGPDPKASALVRAVIRLGHSMGLKVVGEGIEKPVEADALRRAGCGFGQGYHFARPLPAPAFRTLLEAGGVLATTVAGGRPRAVASLASPAARRAVR